MVWARVGRGTQIRPLFWLTLGLINVLHVFMSLYPCGFQANMFTKTRSLKAMSRGPETGR